MSNASKKTTGGKAINPEYIGKTPEEVAFYLLEHAHFRLDYSWQTIASTAEDVDAALGILKTGKLPRDFLVDDET